MAASISSNSSSPVVFENITDQEKIEAFNHFIKNQGGIFKMGGHTVEIVEPDPNMRAKLMASVIIIREKRNANPEAHIGETVRFLNKALDPKNEDAESISLRKKFDTYVEDSKTRLTKAFTLFTESKKLYEEEQNKINKPELDISQSFLTEASKKSIASNNLRKNEAPASSIAHDNKRTSDEKKSQEALEAQTKKNEKIAAEKAEKKEKQLVKKQKENAEEKHQLQEEFMIRARPAA